MLNSRANYICFLLSKFQTFFSHRELFTLSSHLHLAFGNVEFVFPFSAFS